MRQVQEDPGASAVRVRPRHRHHSSYGHEQQGQQLLSGRGGRGSEALRREGEQRNGEGRVDMCVQQHMREDLEVTQSEFVFSYLYSSGRMSESDQTAADAELQLEDGEKREIMGML
eukprot:748587-Hanusia_phi.AAC.2